MRTSEASEYGRESVDAQVLLWPIDNVILYRCETKLIQWALWQKLDCSFDTIWFTSWIRCFKMHWCSRGNGTGVCCMRTSPLVSICSFTSQGYQTVNQHTLVVETFSWIVQMEAIFWLEWYTETWKNFSCCWRSCKRDSYKKFVWWPLLRWRRASLDTGKKHLNWGGGRDCV
jgi:hypothetical protein